MKTINTILFVFLSVSSIFSQSEKEKRVTETREPIRFSKQMKGTFHGKNMSYLASHYETILYEKNEYEKTHGIYFCY
ncbi:MAG: hypothetical protein Ct9H300mP18_11320 [Candidatus Neomarinimicrobiota bacterium]|nr:MAG: hypothetical protein Ct9H300mP18_11320 [Candidatus Neomarinimicrobiota bacterium]